MGKNGRSSVSLCMIVKDEEKRLARCLESARPYVDEFCIVDTGSTDRTVAIALSFGARVKRIEWPDSFAIARNVSLEMATGDWVLVLDADETLRPGEESRLARVIDDPTLIAAYLRLVNHGEKGRLLSCLIMRLFRNETDFRFKFAIHEQIVDDILASAARTGRRLVQDLLCIDHDGYTEAVKSEKGKDERNRLHFEHALKEEPDCAYLWYKFGDFLRRWPEKAPVIDALERAVALVDRMPDDFVRTQTYCAECYTLLALEHVQVREYAQAEDLLRRAHARCVPSPMLYWVSGHLALGLERWDEAMGYFETCRGFDGRAVHVPAQPGITNARSAFGIARARLGRGEREEGIRAIFGGADTWPDCEDFVLAAARIEMIRQDWPAAIRRITRALGSEPENAAYWQVGTELLLELGRQAEALTWCARALMYAPARLESIIQATAGELDLAAGRFEAALGRFAKNLAHPTARAGFALLAMAAGEGLPARAGAVDPELLHGMACIWRRLAKGGAEKGLAAAIRSALDQGPALDPKLVEHLRALTASTPPELVYAGTGRESPARPRRPALTSS